MKTEVPQPTGAIRERLRKLKEIYDDGLINDDDYKKRRTSYLNSCEGGAMTRLIIPAIVALLVSGCQTNSTPSSPPVADKAQKEFEKEMAQAITSSSHGHKNLKPINVSEIDLVRQQIRECWELPAGSRDYSEDLNIEIRMAMNPDGTVREARILDGERLKTDRLFRAAAESALRAVLNPRCSPLKLPPEKYEQWQNMILIFEPHQMMEPTQPPVGTRDTTLEPQGSDSVEERLAKLKELLDKGLLTPDEAAEKRKEILKRL